MRIAHRMQALALALLLGVSLPAGAANRVWTGAGSDDNWSSTNNWGGAAPASGDVLYFAGTNRLSSNNDLAAGTAFGGILFNAGAGAFTLLGNSLVLGADVYNNSATGQTVALPITLNASRGFHTPAGDVVVSGIVSSTSNAYGVTKYDPYALTLSAANTFTGPTAVNGGTLILDYSAQDNGKLADSNSLALAGTLELVGGTHAEQVGGTYFNAGASTIRRASGSATVSLGSLTRNAGATLAVPDVGYVQTTTGSASSLLTAGAGAYAVVGGTDWAAKDAANTGIVGYSSVKTYTPTTATALGGSGVQSDIAAGVTNTTLAAAASTSTLRFSQPQATTIDCGVNSITLTQGGLLVTTNVGVNATLITNGTLKAGSNNALIIHQNNTAGELAIASVIANGSGASELTKSGMGALFLSGTNTYTGSTHLNEGLVRQGRSGVFGATNATLNLGERAVLELNGYALSVGPFYAPTAGAVVTNSSAVSAVVTLGNGGGRITGINTVLFAGNLGLVVVGANATRDDFGGGANTHTGGTTFTGNNTTDRMINGLSLGTGTLTFGGENGGGGFFVPSLGTSNWNPCTNRIVVVGTGNLFSYDTFVQLSGAMSGTGTLRISNGHTSTLKLSGDLGGFSGTLALEGGNGFVALSGTNGAAQAAFNMISSGTSTTTLQWEGPANATVALGDLNTAGNAGTGTITLRNSTASSTTTWAVGSRNAGSTFAGAIAINGNANSALTKVGTGTLTLAGTNTYTGPTVISNGALRVDGALATGTVTVVSGASLGGAGTIGGAVTVSAGAAIHLANGAFGTLTLTNGLALSDGSSLTFDLGSAADKIALTGGSLTNGGTVTINLSRVSDIAAGTYDLVTGGGLAATNGYVLGSVYPGMNYALVATAGTLQVQVTDGGPSTTYWNGDVDGFWNTLSGGTNSNWSDSSGLVEAGAPGLPSDVIFSSATASNLNTTLGRDFYVRSLTFNGAGVVSIGGASVLMVDRGISVGAVAGGGAINTASVLLGYDQIWTNASAGALTVGAPVSGPCSLTKAGAGAITLNGSNTYSGATTVNGGTLTINGHNSSTAGSMVNSGTLALGSAMDSLADTGAVTVNGGEVALGANSDSVGAVTLIGGTISGAGGMLTGSSYDLRSGTVSAGLGGGAGPLKTTTNTLVLSGGSTYTGVTAIAAGLVQLGSGSALGSSSGVTWVASGATLDLNGQTINEPFGDTVSLDGFSGWGTGGQGALINSSLTPAVINGSCYENAFNGIGTGTNGFVVGGPGNITINGSLSRRNTGVGSHTLLKQGTGTLTLANPADNGWFGTQIEDGTLVLACQTNGNKAADFVTLNGGMIRLGSAGGVQQNIYDAGTVTMSGGVFDLNGYGEHIGVLAGTGGVITNASLTNALLWIGYNAGSASSTFAGTIGGNVSIQKDWDATLMLSGSNTYSGVTTVSGGILKLGSPTALGSTNGATAVNTGKTLDLNGQTIAEVFSVMDGTGYGGVGALINSDTNSTAAITSDLWNLGAFTIGGAGNIRLTRLGRTSVLTATKIGTGTLTLTGPEHNNLYAWTVQSGVVELAKTVGGKFAVDRTLTINGGTVRITMPGGNQIQNAVDVFVNGGVFDLNGFSEAVGGLDAAAAGGVVENNGAGAATLFIGGSAGGTNSCSYAGMVRDGTAVLNMAKEGSGTSVLSGTNAYSGTTAVSAGELAVNGTHTGGGAYTVSSNAVLSGAGAISAAATVRTQGTIRPGTGGIGTLSVGALTLESGARLDYDLGAPSASDKIVVAGTLSLNGLQFSDFAFNRQSDFTYGTFVLIDAAAITGSLGSSIRGTVGAGGPDGVLGISPGSDLILRVMPSGAVLIIR